MFTRPLSCLFAARRAWRIQVTSVAAGRYDPLMGTPWGEIVPDGIGAFGVVVAAFAAWLSQRASFQVYRRERSRDCHRARQA
jgi:hypothetical protein